MDKRSRSTGRRILAYTASSAHDNGLGRRNDGGRPLRGTIRVGGGTPPAEPFRQSAHRAACFNRFR